MKIYISGPITSIPTSDAQHKFEQAEKEFAGNTVINPMRISDWNLPWYDYLVIAEMLLIHAGIDVIYMLKGWQKSKGACIEHDLARSMGIKVLYESIDEMPKGE